jgi:hypothetical protein
MQDGDRDLPRPSGRHPCCLNACPMLLTMPAGLFSRFVNPVDIRR